ncbi:hypothetical protein FOQG_19449 [Fusarium oxysporum f. sp. raphani 54005]|uniref:Uncharacterized protein n=1 Tax=Fusarium oxysporum f. sp. raphani 54005 TaxID=1089458 RepID=X0B222_FUSOX|nr:hypothetical protein FOQG_19449 [Fusarium oxysporum f. sp. raphani 54005]
MIHSWPGAWTQSYMLHSWPGTSQGASTNCLEHVETRPK